MFQWEKAIEVAMEAHKDQMYGDKPYICHLLDVDNFVTKMYANVKSSSEQYAKEPEDEIDKLRAVAFLHDLLEDTDVTKEDLVSFGFCEDVVYIVVCMTKIEGQPYHAYLDVVMSCELARKVKICDTAANLTQSLLDKNKRLINKYTKQLQLLGGF